MSDTNYAWTAGTKSMTSTGTLTIEGPVWVQSPPQPRPTLHLFDVEVGHSNELNLIPRTDLARSLLAMWIHGNKGMALSCRGIGTEPVSEHGYGRTVESATITFKCGPVLSSGDDPYFTGMGLSPDEVKAARALVDKMRVERSDSLRRERLIADKTPTKKKRRK